jgi:RNA polymerase sigma factor (sigma-70 family)
VPVHDAAGSSEADDIGRLVLAAADGTQAAWDELVERFGGLVWHVARSYRLGQADAADVSQTVWLRLVESLPKLREPAAVGGWLATTARNECLRVLRRSGREVVDDSIDLLERSDGEESSPEQIVERGEQSRLVAVALERLSQRCRTLLRALAYSPERSYLEVSEALGMPVGSIGPTRGRCLEQLRRELEADDVIAGREQP